MVRRMSKPKITIVGSINMDLITVTDRVAAAGETVAGTHFETLFGGKGANQAVAAARLGADVSIIGKVGDDAFGAEMIKNFEDNGVDTAGIAVEEKTPSGIANIIVADNDNRIIIIAGANGKVDKRHVDNYTSVIKHSYMVLLQFEIPMETVMHTLDICKNENVPVIINPAPVTAFKKEYLAVATYITPNEHERAQLFKMREDGLPEYYEKLITTQGAQGASYFKDGREIMIPPKKVDVVDTTGAGDTFNAAFAVGIAEGMTVEDAIYFANDASGLAVRKLGAQSGMPMRDEM